MKAARVIRGSLFLAIALAAPGPRATALADVPERVVDLDSRPGVVQRLLLLQAADPVGSVILLAGGHGNLDIKPNGQIGWGAENFLVRTRQLFATSGFVVAVMDVSSAFKAPEAQRGYRFSAGHAEDVKAVIRHLRAIKGPVWLIGTSRGTLAAANAAVRLREGAPDGLVLTASVTRGSGSLHDIELEQLRIPTYIVHNRDDQCRDTPFADVGPLKERLRNAPRVELLVVSGGDRPRSDPCEAMSYHGFLGQEAQVVEAITSWIKVNSR